MFAPQSWKNLSLPVFVILFAAFVLLIVLMPASAESSDERVLLFEDDADSLAEANWNRRIAPTDGVYIIDSNHSLGNPNEIETKSVAQGQYLFYGDQRASALTQYTSISKKLPIGPGAWSLVFSAKFKDLMKASQHEIYRGISFEIFAAGKEYKITFNDKNKILGMTNFSSGYQQYAVDMPQDDDFHEWEIAFDGVRTVAVKLDGEVVASFDNIGLDVSGREDELVILNAPLNWESGTNEVYIEQMAMYSSGIDYVPSKTLFEDDAVSLSNAGWQRSMAPIDGLYITDEGSTLGNPNGIEMKEVEPGQYLLYGDQRASDSGRYVRLTKPVEIGNGAWALEFSAKFNDLMTPSANLDYRGVLFEIFAAEQRYKLAFNDKDKIYVSSNSYKQVPMPDDDEFHTWTIMFNGVDTVYVELDGNIVASFEGIAMAAAGTSDRVQIGNVPLNWQAGTNEMYIDSIKLYTMETGDPNVLIDDDAADFITANWEVDAPNLHAYFTDHHQSNGSIDGMLSVEENRYLTYADSTAAENTKMTQSVEIGSSPWALELDARMASLIHPNVSGSGKGFKLEIVADGKKHSFVFNDENKLYINQMQGSDIQVETNLISDHYFDQWGIAYDEHERLIVTKNGEKLGVWSLTGEPAAEADRITFINEAGTGVSGETEVYMDRIKLTKKIMPEWSEFQPLIDGVTILPTSDSDRMEAVVSLYDADPLRFQNNRLMLEAELTQEGQAVQHLLQEVDNDKITLQFHTQGQTGWMDLSLKLLDASQIKNEVTHKVEVHSAVTELLPGDEAVSVSEAVYLYTAMNQMTGNDGRSLWQAGWEVAEYQYDGTDESGLFLQNTNQAGTLNLPITLDGWFGVYVGFVSGTEGFIVSSEHESRVLNIEGTTLDPDQLYGHKGIAEEFAFAADFSQGTVSLSAVPGKLARIAYIKLKGFSAEEIALYNKAEEGEAGKRVIYNNDGYSDYFSGKYDTPQALLDNAVNIFEGQDVNSLYFALGTTLHILRDSQIAGGRPYSSLTPEQEQNLMRDGDKKVRDVIWNYIDAGLDPLQIVAQRLNEIDVDAYASLRMSAFYNPEVYPWLNGNRYDEFVAKGYRLMNANGSPTVRISYAYPEFQQFIIDVLKEAASVTDEQGQNLIKGVELDYCRYPYVLGYESILIDAYIAEYGIDPREETSQAGEQRWNEFRAEVMNEFMRDVRMELAGKQISTRIPHDLYVQNNLDIETWIQEGLIDRLVICTLSHETFFDDIAYFETLTEGTDVEIYGNINGTLSGNDLTRQEEDMMKRGIRLNRGGSRVSKQQYMLRAHEFYQAGYDGIYLFNNWGASTPEGQTILGQLGDKVKVEKWYHLAYPAEWVQNLVTVSEPVSIASIETKLHHYISDGQINMLLTKQLENSLKQLRHHWTAGREAQALNQLDKFLKHLNNEAMQKHITSAAAHDLQTDVEKLANWLR